MCQPLVQSVRYPSAVPAVSAVPSSGARLVSADGRALPLKSTRLVARACAGRARVTVEQRFVNVHSEPLAVTYQLPLPADGAVAGFDFVLAGQRVVGRIEKRAAAREQFENAVAEGRTAALLEQARSSVFTQELGNLPPGAEVLVCVRVDQPLAWLAEGAWEWRFPSVVAPRYQGSSGRVQDAERLLVAVNAQVPEQKGPVLELALEVRDALAAGSAPSSPSHPLNYARSDGGHSVSLGVGQDAPLDRDVVVRWTVAGVDAGVSLETERMNDACERAFGSVTIVPPKPEYALTPLARDLIVLLDTSGSMGGAPLDQAKRVTSALVEGLRPGDTLELLSFGSSVQRFAPQAARIDANVRSKALTWIAALRASGSTEMREGIREALRAVRHEGQRQVLLITDGLIGFETEVIADVLQQLPPCSRVHTLGIGSGVNRSLTGPVARAGRGSEHVVAVDEDVMPVLKRVLAKLEAPVITNLRVSGSGLRAVGTERLPDVHAASPLCLPLELAPGGGQLLLEGDTAAGVWRHELELTFTRSVASLQMSALATAFGRERVEDLELQRAAGGHATLDAAIEKLGLSFAIATRMTSWIAVRQEPSVDPSEPTRHLTQPQSLPHGMSVEGLGLRAAAVPFGMARSLAMPMSAPAAFAPGAFSPAPPAQDEKARVVNRSRRMSPSPQKPPAAPAKGGALHSAKTWLGKLLGGDGPADGSVQPLVLEAKIAVHSADRLILNVTLASDLQWSCPLRVKLELSDGSVVELDVDPRSTRSGNLQGAQTLRLWLKLPSQLSADPSLVDMGTLHLRITK